MAKKKVLLAMSGGIDSSVAAILLLEQGYEVIGVTMVSFDYETIDCDLSESNCCSFDSLNDAKQFAKQLGFKHILLDIIKDFKKEVIDDFIDEYMSGRTPNPCVLCNSKVRWEHLLKMAHDLECDFVATGHYARIEKVEDRFVISKGVDEKKDQSYFLWGITQDILKKTLFPLGGYTKDKIKEIARNHGFEKLAEKKESMDICFIPDNDYRGFLKRNIDDLDKLVGEGDFISTDGKVLGKHKGYPFYTIGQRKGLEIALGIPMYVVEIDSKSNTVMLGTEDDLFINSIWLDNINLFRHESIPDGLEVTTKIRYRNVATKSKIYSISNRVRVDFDEPVSAVTPGQSSVFYIDEEVIGGGIIVK